MLVVGMNNYRNNSAISEMVMEEWLQNDYGNYDEMLLLCAIDKCLNDLMYSES